MNKTKWFRAPARELYHEEGEIEIDDNAHVSTEGGEGAYVEAWVWVPSERKTENSSSTGTSAKGAQSSTPNLALNHR
jgi:hypothetical protein